MKRLFVLTMLTAALAFGAAAQSVSLEKGWVFSTGDSTQWASASYNDKSWKPIDVHHPWEQQGYDKYDGFGWYRLHVFIPASLRDNAYLKDSVRLNLGIVDDNDEVYLNGEMIAAYGKKAGGSIKKANFGWRSYTLATSNPAILWGKENVFAVRIFDTGGDGGMYGEVHNMVMNSVLDDAGINTDGSFEFGDNGSLGKSVKLVTNSNYTYSGVLKFRAVDPESGKLVIEKTVTAGFSAGKPYRRNIRTC
jgi:alpha-galactosidase